MKMRQHVYPSVHEFPAVKLRTEMNPGSRRGKFPEWPITASFIGKSYDVITRPVMSRIHHRMMSLVTSFHDVTS